MNPIKQAWKGSPSRDLFKYLRKRLPGSFYALDADLELVNKNPPFIVARLDFKKAGDIVTFTEALAYNEMVEKHRIPVFIIEAVGEFLDVHPSKHRFNVYEYHEADWRPQIPVVDKTLLHSELTWPRLGKWEADLRKQRILEVTGRVN